MSTEQPLSSAIRPPRLEPCRRPPKSTCAWAPQSERSDDCPDVPNESQSAPELLRCIFVEFDEIAQGYGKVQVFVGAKRIKSQHILETSDDNCKAQRVEARVQEHQVIRQRC